jgi:hypothetical protein
LGLQILQVVLENANVDAKIFSKRSLVAEIQREKESEGIFRG